MDQSSVRTTPSIEEDEWGHRCTREISSNTDGFVIPSLTVGEQDLGKQDLPEESDVKPTSPKVTKEEEKIYLGPHGAPPQAKQQELKSASRKQRLRHKIKEVDRKFTGSGRENKLENLRELVGGKVNVAMPKGPSRDWLDPHCHESQFERYSD